MASSRANGPAARRGCISRPDRGRPRATRATGQTRPQGPQAQVTGGQLSMVSPEFTPEFTRNSMNSMVSPEFTMCTRNWPLCDTCAYGFGCN